MSTHIGAKKGDIAKAILLPGDPLRAKYIAENYLENPVCFNEVRGMYGFTGTYKGKVISVMGTGMGMPSIAIYAHELIQEYGVEILIRVGTCGAMQNHIHVSDVIIAQGACTTSDMNHFLFPGTYAPVSDFHLIRAAKRNADKVKDAKVYVGNVLSADMFYEEELVADMTLWQKYNVLAVEMEAAALLTVAKKLDAKAMAMFTVSDHMLIEEPPMSSEEREKSLNNMITTALDTACEFI